MRNAAMSVAASTRSGPALACNLYDQRMDKKHADKNYAEPWLVWLASVLAAAVFIIYIVQSA
jgi:hypothetical protein